MSDWLERNLKSWLGHLQRHGVSPRNVFLLLSARSAGASAGLTYDGRPWLAELDRQLLAQASDVVQAAGDDLHPSDEAAWPPDHWWWFLDEIAAGSRPRPEVP